MSHFDSCSTDRALCYASILFTCVGIAAVIHGMLLLFVNELSLFIAEDVRYIGMDATTIIAYNPRLYTWVAVVYRLWGTFLAAAGMLVTALAAVPLRKKEPWSWYMLAISTIPALLSWIFVVAPFDSYFFPALTAATAVCSVALLLSYPAVFSKRATKTYT